MRGQVSFRRPSPLPPWSTDCPPASKSEDGGGEKTGKARGVERESERVRTEVSFSLFPRTPTAMTWSRPIPTVEQLVCRLILRNSARRANGIQ